MPWRFCPLSGPSVNSKVIDFGSWLGSSGDVHQRQPEHLGLAVLSILVLEVQVVLVLVEHHGDLLHLSAGICGLPSYSH